MIRGLWTHAAVLYSVKDGTLYSIDSNGQQVSLGALNSTAGVVDFESNHTQLCINDGSYLYVYTPLTGVLTTSANYPGGDRLSFLDQRVNFMYRGTQQFGWTDLANAVSINVLSFASAESTPTALVSQLAFNHELWLFKTDATEIWDPIGGLTVYQKSTAAIDYGCVAAHSAQKTANSVIWLSQDKGGQAMVLSAVGHQAQRISTRSQEEQFEGLSLAGARAFTYTDGGQSLYCLNIPGLTTTLVWDETFKQWHERAEYVNGAYAPWRATCHAFAYGRHYFGTLLGDLYIADRNTWQFGTDPIVRERIAPVISAPDQKRVSYPRFEILCEKGTGATVMLSYSDDNGANWSNWIYTTVGSVGVFKARARFNRLGSGYDRVFRVRMTDNAPFNPVDVNVPLV